MKQKPKFVPKKQVEAPVTAVLKKKQDTYLLKVKSVIRNMFTSLYIRVSYSSKRYAKLTAKKILLSKLFHTAFKVFVGLFLLSLVSYSFYVYFNRTTANDVVVSKSEIIDRASKLTALPNGVPDAVVRVEDPETLKKQNSFYENVKNGDYILMYPNVAIIYDLRNNSIVAIKKSE